MKLFFYGMVLTLAVSGVAGAYMPKSTAQNPKDNHRYLIENADFIVSGEVKKIQYEAIPRQGEIPISTTLVTYRVHRVFHGNLKADNFIRLRFLGGPVDKERTYFHLPYIPTFEVGDQDMLFIVNNGVDPCPLVKCMQGRVRVKNGLLKNDMLWTGHVALTFDGTTLYPAQEPIEPGDIHTFDQYSQKLAEVLDSGQFAVKTSNNIVLDARTIPFSLSK